MLGKVIYYLACAIVIECSIFLVLAVVWVTDNWAKLL